MSLLSSHVDILAYSDQIIAGFTHRGEDGFNLALHVNDNPEKVIRNRKELCRQLGIPFEAYTCANQVHGCRVAPVTCSQRGRGRLNQKNTIGEWDALITNEREIMLNIFVADCVPIILYDQSTRSGGVCHAGWRGTSQSILLKTIETMKNLFGTDSSQIQAWIGPSIGVCCYKVGELVRKEMQNNFTYKESPFEEKADGLYCNLKSANYSQLLLSGIPKKNIQISQDCTFCSGDKYDSHRKKRRTGWPFLRFFLY